MRLRPIIALVALATALALLSVLRPAAHARGRALPARERDEIARAVERELREAYDLGTPGVERRLLALYGDTGHVVSAAGGRMFTSRDTLASGIHSFWENVGRNMRQPRWIWEHVAIDVLSRDAAVVTATYRVPHRTPAGVPHELGGAMTAVFVRDGDRWRIVQEHLSDRPAPEGAAVDSAPSAPDTMP